MPPAPRSGRCVVVAFLSAEYVERGTPTEGVWARPSGGVWAQRSKGARVPRHG